MREFGKHKNKKNIFFKKFKKSSPSGHTSVKKVMMTSQSIILLQIADFSFNVNRYK
jgi:hypothetical protein